MKRLCFTLLVACLLLSIPATAQAAVISPTVSVAGYGSTTYSNVPGFSLAVRCYYYSANYSQNRVTKETLSATLSPTRVWLGVYLYNKQGTIGPGTMYLYSSGRAISSYPLSARVVYPGGSTTYTWYPSLLTTKYAAYGSARANWSQVVAPYSVNSLSTANPVTLRTSSF